MPQVEHSIVIAAPVEAVFDLIANQPERQPEWWPPIEETERVTPPPTAVGSISRYVYNMMGVPIKGEHKVIEMTPNRHLIVKTISGIDSTFDFTFMPVNGSTNLTIRVDYTMPGSVLGQLLNKLIIEEKNERDLLDGLHNLKQILES
jgi:uncharacterized membrane protein